MESPPRFSFGDLTEEEQDCYLTKQQTCVEFPPSWTIHANGESGGHLMKPFDKITIAKDENENHMPKEQSGHRIESNTASNIPVVIYTDKQNGDDNILQTNNAKELSINGTSLEFVTSRIEPTLINTENIDNSPSTENQSFINGYTDNTSNSSQHDDSTQSRTMNTSGHAYDDVSQNPENETENCKACSANDETQATNIELATKESKNVSSWASLFNNNPTGSNQPPSKQVIIKPKTKLNGSSSNRTNTSSRDSEQKKGVSNNGGGSLQNGFMQKSDPTIEVVNIEDDVFSKQIADQISRNEIVYRSPGLMPRGFINSSNWCYINATLQALLTSSPFCHLMRSFPSRNQNSSVIQTSTPVLDSFVRLVKELKPLPKKDNRNYQRANKEQWHGSTHEPEYIYKMLATIKSKFSERGRQEDAEEFLSCVLNGLHEEMLKVTEFYSEQNSSGVSNDDDLLSKEDDLDNNENEEEDEWEEVTCTRKNRNSVMRHADITRTPLSDIFRGELRSDFFPEDQRSTATLEPFYTLPLDIKDQMTWSVKEALDHLTRLESVQDFTDSKTKTKVKADRRLTFQTLPPVLVLHLKRFVYDKTGGSLKLDKEVQYHTDLTIGKELITKAGRKNCGDKRFYKLFAVVYHHGKKSTGGHYSTDVYHGGLNCWLRIDDQHIKQTNVHEVVRHNPLRTAYLLYYKRTDLMAV